MTNWFYYDNAGQKLGPFTDQQIRFFAMQKRISPETILEMENGTKGKASNIAGLFPANSANSSGSGNIYATQSVPSNTMPSAASSSAYTSGASYAPNNSGGGNWTPPPYSPSTGSASRSSSTSFPQYTSPVLRHTQKGNWLGWLFNFSFNDIRLPAVNLILTRVVYVIFLIVAIIMMIVFPLGIIINIIGDPYIRQEISGFWLFFGSIFGTLFYWFLCICIIIFERLCLEYWILLFDWIVSTKEAAQKIINQK